MRRKPEPQHPRSPARKRLGLRPRARPELQLAGYPAHRNHTAAYPHERHDVRRGGSY